MKTRIIAIALISSAIAFALFLIPLAVAVFSLYLADAQATLERSTLNAAIAVDPTFSRTDPAELPVVDAAEQLGLYDTSGSLIIGTGPQTADPPVGEALKGRTDQAQSGGWIISVVPINAGEQVTGAVRAAAPLAGVWQRTIMVWLLLVLAAAAALAIGILAARSLTRRITRPMDTLTSASESLGDGNFGVRIVPTGLPEVDQVGSALNATASRLDDLVSRERHLAANASHQLRTPLTGLRVLLESGLSSATPGLNAILVQAIERADRLEATIDELIALGRGLSVATSVDVERELMQADRRWSGTLAAAARPLRVDAAQRLPSALVDPSALQQILDILIENALRHGAGEVTLRARASHGTIAFDVEDEGSSTIIGDEIFRQGLSHGGGSGLGLALARQLAGDQGGRLILASCEPGTRFTLLIPVAEKDPAIRTRTATSSMKNVTALE